MGVKKPVFAVTNLGTRVVVPVAVDCTAAQFKKEFQSVHLEIHPEHGKLRVDCVKVEFKSFFYNVCDSVPVEHLLGGEHRSLHVQASKSAPLVIKETSSDEKQESKNSQKEKGLSNDANLEASKSAPLLITETSSDEKQVVSKNSQEEKGLSNDDNLEASKSDPLVIKETSFDEKQVDLDVSKNSQEEKKLSNDDNLEASKSVPLVMKETSPDENLEVSKGINDANLEGDSEPVSKNLSVTGILNKYFSTGDDEVNSYSKLPLFPVVPQLHQEQTMSNLGVGVADGPKTTSVGARIMEASQSLRISSANNSPAHQLSKIISTEPVKSTRRLIFE